MRKLTTEESIEKARAVHGDRYSYEKSEYVKSTVCIKITCRTHGDFLQTPKKHFIGHGCRECGGSLRLDSSRFIERCISTHGERYDYSLVNYVSMKVKVIIVCKEHGEFTQSPLNHLCGKGCPGCAEHGFKRTNKDAFVYFLMAPTVSAVKVGITHDKFVRIKRLIKNTPFHFELIKIIKTTGFNAAKTERYFHEKFKSAGFLGFDGCTEWLQYSAELMSDINKEAP